MSAFLRGTNGNTDPRRCGGGGGGEGGGLCLKILLSTEILMETHIPGVVEVEEVGGGGGELCLKILTAFLRSTDGNTDP